MAKTTYLLPCPCGASTHVDAGQAGMSLKCQCGAELAVPTLRGFSQLERVEQAAEKPAPTWGAKQALAFAGLSITLVSLAVAAVFWLTAPRFPQEKTDAYLIAIKANDQIDRLSTAELISLWKTMSTTFDASVLVDIAVYEEAHEMYRSRLRVAMIVACCGLVIAAASLLVPRSKKQRM